MWIEDEHKLRPANVLIVGGGGGGRKSKHSVEKSGIFQSIFLFSFDNEKIVSDDQILNILMLRDKSAASPTPIPLNFFSYDCKEQWQG